MTLKAPRTWHDACVLDQAHAVSRRKRNFRVEEKFGLQRCQGPTHGHVHFPAYAGHTSTACHQLVEASCKLGPEDRGSDVSGLGRLAAPFRDKHIDGAARFDNVAPGHRVAVLTMVHDCGNPGRI